MVFKTIKKRKGDYIYHFYPLCRTAMKVNRFNFIITYRGFGCSLSRCLFSDFTCKFCPYCQI